MPNYRWVYISYQTYGLVNTEGKILATIFESAYRWHYKDEQYIDKNSAQKAAESDVGVTA